MKKEHYMKAHKALNPIVTLSDHPGLALRYISESDRCGKL